MKTTFKTVSALKDAVMNSQDLQNELKTDPKQFFEKLESKPPLDIPWVFIVVVSIIGIALVTSLIYVGQVALAEAIKVGKVSEIREIPEIFGVIASACIAAIAGLLAPSPMQNQTKSN